MFQRSVQRRSSRIRFVDEGSHERELSIRLVKDGSFTVGELRLIEADGSLRQRSVRFSSCPEAVEGLALITLVSLDPHALLEAPITQAAAPPPEPTRPLPAAEKPAQPAIPPLPREPLQPALGLLLGGTYHALPELAPSAELFFDLGSGSHSWLSPLLRLSLAHSQVRGVEVSSAEASFASTLATLSACPIRVGAHAFSVRPCLFISGGALHAWGEETTNARAHTRPQASWGGAALGFVRVSEAVDIVGDLRLGSTLIRDQFAFDTLAVWKTPPLYLSSGIGARFVFR